MATAAKQCGQLDRFVAARRALTFPGYNEPKTDRFYSFPRSRVGGKASYTPRRYWS